MATNWQSFTLSFSGGLVSNLGLLDHGATLPGSAKTLINFEADLGSGYKKVLGYRKFIDSVVPGISGKIACSVSVGSGGVVAARGTKYYYGEIGSPWTEIATVTTPIPTRVRFSRYDFGLGDKIVFVDGVNLPRVFDVQTKTMAVASLSTDVEGASFVCAFADRLFYAKGSVLTYSNLFTSGGFDPAVGAGSFSFKSDITGLIVFRDKLIIFQEDSIDQLSGSTEADFQIVPITRKTGCSWPDSIQEVGGDILYRGPDGVRYLSATEKVDDFALSRASEQIQNNITEDFVAPENAVSLVIRNKNQYRLFYYSEGDALSQKGFTCTRTLDQTSTGSSWSELSGFRVYCADSVVYEGEEIVLFSDGFSYVYQMEWGYSFDGGPIPCEFQTPFWVFEDPSVRKTFYKHKCYIKLVGEFFLETQLVLNFNESGEIQPYAKSFSKSSPADSTYGVGVYGSAVYTSFSKNEFSENLVGSGFSASIIYKNNDTNPSFTLSSLDLQYSYSDRK